jgi:hypothetical protein
MAKRNFHCAPPRRANLYKQASNPHGLVWFLHCGNTSYRVTLIPDRAAHVVEYPPP